MIYAQVGERLPDGCGCGREGNPAYSPTGRMPSLVRFLPSSSYTLVSAICRFGYLRSIRLPDLDAEEAEASHANALPNDMLDLQRGAGPQIRNFPALHVRLPDGRESSPERFMP